MLDADRNDKLRAMVPAIPLGLSFHINLRTAEPSGKSTPFIDYFSALSTVRFSVPSESSSDNHQPGFTKTGTLPTTQSETGAKILVVEDNYYFAELLGSFLQTEGHEAILASTGEKAVEIYSVEKKEIALVILDLLMPGMSGKECLMKLLRHNPAVKVMILTVLDPGDGLCKEIAPYIKGILHKPCKMAEFIHQTRRLLVN